MHIGYAIDFFAIVAVVVSAECHYHFLEACSLVFGFEDFAYFGTVVESLFDALVREEYAPFVSGSQVFFQPIHLFGVDMGSFLGIYIIVGASIMSVLFAVEEVVAVQNDEVEIALVE